MDLLENFGDNFCMLVSEVNLFFLVDKPIAVFHAQLYSILHARSIAYVQVGFVFALNIPITTFVIYQNIT